VNISDEALPFVAAGLFVYAAFVSDGALALSNAASSNSRSASLLAWIGLRALRHVSIRSKSSRSTRVLIGTTDLESIAVSV
jgi:hypothetical protein